MEEKLNLKISSDICLILNDEKLIFTSTGTNFEIRLEYLKNILKYFSNLYEEIEASVLRINKQIKNVDSILLEFEQKMKASK